MSETLGPTGEFPQGKLGPDDSGELRLAIANAKGKVIVDFGASVRWLGLDPQDAANLAEGLLFHARQAGAELGTPLTFNLLGTWVQPKGPDA